MLRHFSETTGHQRLVYGIAVGVGVSQLPLPLDLPSFNDSVAQEIFANNSCQRKEKARHDARSDDHGQIWPDRRSWHLRGSNHRVSVLEGRLGDRKLDPRTVGSFEDAFELIQLESQANAGEVGRIARAVRLLGPRRRRRQRLKGTGRRWFLGQRGPLGEFGFELFLLLHFRHRGNALLILRLQMFCLGLQRDQLRRIMRKRRDILLNALNRRVRRGVNRGQLGEASL